MISRSRDPRDSIDVSAWHASQKASYQAARDSRFRKRRSVAAMGSHGDYHLPGNDYLRIMEYARALDRDDSVIGSILDRAEINTVQNGFTLDFDTGDTTLDEELLGGWLEWAGDANQCDLAGELSFAEMESMVYRFAQVDGDFWGLLTEDDQIQCYEAHRIRTPSGSTKDGKAIINGVELDGNRRRLQAWISREDIAPWSASVGEFDARQFRDGLGMRRMLQVYCSNKRLTLTRGMSAFQKLYELSGMLEDTEFAAILKQQLQNALVFTEEMTAGDPGGFSQFGEQTEEVRPDGTVEKVEGIGAGVIVRSRNGKALRPFMSSGIGPELIGHLKHIITVMGINLGMPLVLALMDASETNFSGWRAAFDQAKLGFQRNQGRLLKRWHNPILAWRLRAMRWKKPSLDAAMERIVTKARQTGVQWYKWHLPSWPYVNPLEDTQASLLAVSNYLCAPSTDMARNCMDYDREMRRGIRDREFAIELAIEAADRLNKKYKSLGAESPAVQWMDLYTPPAPKHVQFSISESRESQSQQSAGSQKQGA